MKPNLVIPIKRQPCKDGVRHQQPSESGVPGAGIQTGPLLCVRERERKRAREEGRERRKKEGREDVERERVGAETEIGNKLCCLLNSVGQRAEEERKK